MSYELGLPLSPTLRSWGEGATFLVPLSVGENVKDWRSRLNCEAQFHAIAATDH